MQTTNIKILHFILVMQFLCFTCFRVYASSPSVSAASAVVIEVNSGRKLYEKNCYQKLGMASTTKIMTAIVALENGNLGDLVKVSAAAAQINGSSMWLDENEEITLENLLYGLMLVSGNDAATAIAEHISGSIEKFATLMNQTANRIGAVNTHFMNPHGLANNQHYTTAYDLALITAYGFKIPKFSEIVKTQVKRIPWGNKGYNRILSNHNKMLYLYDGCNGVKTGFTRDTGRCLVSSAVRNGMQLIVVTLRAGEDWEDHKNMLNYSFGHYCPCLLVERRREYGEIIVEGAGAQKLKLITASDIYFPATSEEYKKIKIIPHAPCSAAAPIQEGSTIGYLSVWVNNAEYKIHCLIAHNNVLEKSIIKNFKDELLDTFGQTLTMWLKTSKVGPVSLSDNYYRIKCLNKLDKL